jgi:hypothetical protein
MPWREQTFPMEVAHVYAMTLAGRSLLIEPVPVAGAFAAHNFLPVFLPKSYAKFTTQEQEAALALGIVYLASELLRDAEDDLLIPLGQASAIMISPTFIRSEFPSLNTRLPSHNGGCYRRRVDNSPMTAPLMSSATTAAAGTSIAGPPVSGSIGVL